MHILFQKSALMTPKNELFASYSVSISIQMRFLFWELQILILLTKQALVEHKTLFHIIFVIYANHHFTKVCWPFSRLMCFPQYFH